MAGLPDPEGGGDAEADPSRACHVFPPLLHETETRYKDFESKIFESCEPRNISNPTFGPETADPRKNRFDSRNIRFMNPCPSVSRPRPAAIVRTVLDVPGPQRLIPRTAPPGVIRLRRLPDRGPDHCCEKKGCPPSGRRRCPGSPSEGSRPKDPSGLEKPFGFRIDCIEV